MVKCDYCQQEAGLVGGLAIYPHRPDLAKKWFYRCAPCDAYVGCHPNTKSPLGRIANAELRKAKSAAHFYFDPLWQIGSMSRTKAYKWMARTLDLPPSKAHIGMFDVAQCNALVAAIQSMKVEA